MDGKIDKLFRQTPLTKQQQLEAAFTRLGEQIGDNPDFVIHKVAVPFKGDIRMPLGATVIHVGEQHGTLFAWYIFAAEADVYQKIPVAVIGTGVRVGPGFRQTMQFCRTVQMADGLVWHMFTGEAELD